MSIVGHSMETLPMSRQKMFNALPLSTNLVLSQKANRLVRDCLASVNPCWLVSITFSFTQPERHSKRTCYMVFQRTEEKLTSL